MSTARIQKLLLIWKNYEGKPRYFRLATPADHVINADLKRASGRYLNAAPPTSAAEQLAIQNIHAYVKDSGQATALTEAALSGPMGWDRIYITGIQTN